MTTKQKLVPIVALVAAAAAAFVFRAELVTWFAGESRGATIEAAHQHQEGVAYYTCPMHPAVRSDRPG